MANEIMINVNRCTGCWTCSQACKAAYKLDVDEYRLAVRTIGGGKIDQAGGTWPNLYMKWNPVFTHKCTACAGDDETGNVPHCAFNCPTGAMMYGDTSDLESEISKAREALLEKGYHMWTMPDWEETRAGITYIECGI